MQEKRLSVIIDGLIGAPIAIAFGVLTLFARGEVIAHGLPLLGRYMLCVAIILFVTALLKVAAAVIRAAA